MLGGPDPQVRLIASAGWWKIKRTKDYISSEFFLSTLSHVWVQRKEFASASRVYCDRDKEESMITLLELGQNGNSKKILSVKWNRQKDCKLQATTKSTGTSVIHASDIMIWWHLIHFTWPGYICFIPKTKIRFNCKQATLWTCCNKILLTK